MGTAYLSSYMGVNWDTLWFKSPRKDFHHTRPPLEIQYYMYVSLFVWYSCLHSLCNIFPFVCFYGLCLPVYLPKMCSMVVHFWQFLNYIFFICLCVYLSECWTFWIGNANSIFQWTKFHSPSHSSFWNFWKKDYFPVCQTHSVTLNIFSCFL